MISTRSIFSLFSSLSTKYDLPRSHYFRYLKIRHYLSSQFSSFPSLPALSPWEELLKLPIDQKSLTSRIYSSVMSFDKKTAFKIKLAWEEEIGVKLSDEYWAGAMERISSTTSCARLGLIHFKVLYRLHYSKAKLAEIYLSADNRCDRCSHTPANLSYLFFFCPKLQSFWGVFFKILSDILKIKLQLDPLTTIFGVPELFANLYTSHLDIIAFSSLIARRRILLSWKSPGPPSAASWLEDMLSFLKLEKIKFSLRGSAVKFTARWQPFLSYVNSLHRLPTEQI